MEDLSADKTWTVAKSGGNFSRIQDAVDYIAGNVNRRGFVPTVHINDGSYNETVSLSGAGCMMFFTGNPGNPRAVWFNGLQVRDFAIALILEGGMSFPWILQAQNSIIDAAGFVLSQGALPTGFQIALDDNSKISVGSYSIDVSATAGHVYCGHGSRFSQAGGSRVLIGPWLSLGTFYRAQWEGGMIDLGANINYVNGDQVTAIPFDLTNRGTLSRGANAIPGSKYWQGVVADGLLVG